MASSLSSDRSRGSATCNKLPQEEFNKLPREEPGEEFNKLPRKPRGEELSLSSDRSLGSGCNKLPEEEFNKLPRKPPGDPEGGSLTSCPETHEELILFFFFF